jgi:hypothetical protein
VTAAALALWMSADVEERVDALASLLTSGDLVSTDTNDGEAFGVTRVDRLLPRLEWPEPILPPAMA